MGTFILRRLAQAIPVILLSTIGVFLLLHLLPGDPALVLAGSDAPPSAIEAISQDMGLDQPLATQYVVWLGHIARGENFVVDFSEKPGWVLNAAEYPMP